MRSQIKSATVKKGRSVKKSPSQTAHSQQLLQEIEKEAYFRFLNRGSQHGFDHEDWIAAEREVKARHQASSN